MPRARRDDHDRDDDDWDDEPRPEDRLPPKARLFGGLLFVLGVMVSAAVLGGAADQMGGRMLGLMVSLASGGIWIGIGLLAFPPTRGQLETVRRAENNAFVLFKLLPSIWKVWLVFTAVAFIGTLKARDERNTIVLPGR